MRIAQTITLGHKMYGAQKHLLDLSIAFKNDGHEVLVVVGTSGPLTDACERHGIQWRHCPSLQRSIHPVRDWVACRELRKIFLDFCPDAVGSHSSKAGLVTRWVCSRMGIPNTFTAHGWSFEDGVPFVRRLIYRSIEKMAGKFSDRIITVSNLGRDLALKHKIVPENKLEMIYYGTDDSGGQIAKNAQEVFTMTMVAGFREQKDHATLVKALSGIKDREWQLFFLGDGPLLPSIEDQAQDAGIKERIHFEGMVDNVSDYLAMTDLLVLITNWEGLPISTLEGLTFSLPVVASDVSGVREQVIDGVNGFTVQRGDVDAVRSVIEKMMDSKSLRESFAENSRKLYLSQFTIEAMYQKTLAVYESLASKN